MSRDIFQPAWLTYLVRDFGVSAAWLLTGVGGMFVPGINKKAALSKKVENTANLPG